MIECIKCHQTKPEVGFQRDRTTKLGYRKTCKQCLKEERDQAGGAATSHWRRRTKERLIESHGGKCVDCGHVGPPFHFHFDHRNPEEKKFGISRYALGYDSLYQESLKCDLVCALCHADRTHRQRCNGCEHCQAGAPEWEPGRTVDPLPFGYEVRFLPPAQLYPCRPRPL